MSTAISLTQSAEIARLSASLEEARNLLHEWVWCYGAMAWGSRMADIAMRSERLIEEIKPQSAVSTAGRNQQSQIGCMIVHYALQSAEQGDAPIALFSVEIDGGSLSTGCVVPDADPAALGSMAGIICNHLHMNAKFFPGDDRSEERTERRHLHYGNGQAGGQVVPLMGEFDVTFTPAEPL